MLAPCHPAPCHASPASCHPTPRHPTPCHPERSEGSPLPEDSRGGTRSFAALRMTRAALRMTLAALRMTLVALRMTCLDRPAFFVNVHLVDTCLTAYEYPGGLLLSLLFKGRDLVVMAERPADVIETLQQGVLTEVVDVEMNLATIGLRQRLRREIDMQLVA